jgi:succinate-acetate transporter protein
MAEAKANPAPLGLAGFGLTTVVLSAINAGWVTGDAKTVVIPLAFAYGGAAQIIAGILEYTNGNTFGMVAFTSYGLFWWWWAFYNFLVGAGALKASPVAGIGVALLLWGVFTFYMWIATWRSNRGVWSIFLLLWITFILLGLGDLGVQGFTRLGGYVGLVTGIDALYVSFAEVVNAAHGKMRISFLVGTRMSKTV